MWPREHGAYGQLGLPLVAALAMGRPTLASALLVSGAWAAFVAHEPLLVWLGARGPRARREHGARAARLGVGLAIAALAMAATAVALGGRPIALAAVFPLVLLLGLVPFLLTGKEKTTAGEVLAGAALASASIPVSVAAGVPLASVGSAFVVWAVALTAGTAAVRWVIARHRTGKSTPALVAIVTAATAAGALLATGTVVAVAAVPMVGAAWALLGFPPHPRALRRVGWTLVACSSATAGLVVVLTRLTR